MVLAASVVADVSRSPVGEIVLPYEGFDGTMLRTWLLGSGAMQSAHLVAAVLFKEYSGRE